MAKNTSEKSTAASPRLAGYENMNDKYYWADDTYWTDALTKNFELRDNGQKQIVLDRIKLSDLAFESDGPAYKLMEAMVSVWEREGMDGFRGAPRVLLAMLVRLEELSKTTNKKTPNNIKS